MQKKKPIIFVARSGLSNRLRALAGCMAIAHHSKSPLLVNWKIQGACNKRLDELFQISYKNNIELISENYLNKLKLEFPDRYFDTTEQFSDIYDKTLCPTSFNNYCNTSVHLLRNLVPIQKLHTIINLFIKDYNLADCIGIHIRMTDNLQCYQIWKESDPYFDESKISELQSFIKIITDYKSSNQKVFLATDNKEICDFFVKNFDNVVAYQKEYISTELMTNTQIINKNSLILKIKKILNIAEPINSKSWRTTSIEDALIDLYLLSNCRKIIGTYYSSFSQVSALIGGRACEILERDKLVTNEFVTLNNILASESFLQGL